MSEPEPLLTEEQGYARRVRELRAGQKADLTEEQVAVLVTAFGPFKLKRRTSG